MGSLNHISAAESTAYSTTQTLTGPGGLYVVGNLYHLISADHMCSTQQAMFADA
jgi:hypothetical protein